MIRTYLFGCHEHIKAFRSFVVNVGIPDKDSNPEKLHEAALTKAGEVAKKEGLPDPVLLYEAGVPDLRIILDRGEVAAVFCRNASIVPSITVTDLDYAANPKKEATKLQSTMDNSGYAVIPHAID